MNNLFQRTMFNPLVEEYGVDLVLQGHEHAYARMTAHGENGEAPSTCLYSQSLLTQNYYIEFDKRFDKFGTGSRYYQQIRVHGDTLTMNAYDATTNDLYDAVDIIKDKTGKSRLEDRWKREFPKH